MSALVKAEYQDVAVSFTEGGWDAITGSAKKFGSGHCIYCITFTHGLMKVGAASNINGRLQQLNTHGLLQNLFEGAVFVRTDNRFAAEAIALKLFTDKTKQHHSEVFSALPIAEAAVLLQQAVEQTPERPKPGPFSVQDYASIAESSGLLDALLSIKRRERYPVSIAEAVAFVISHEGCEEGVFEATLDCLHPLTLELVSSVIRRNTKLISDGWSYEDRKAELEKFAEEQRAAHPILAGTQKQRIDSHV